LLSAAAAAAIALAVILVSTRDSDEPRQADELVAGQIYSTDDGDPIDLLYAPSKPGTGCMTFVSAGVFYTGGSNVTCFDLEDIRIGGTYQLVLARRAEDPAVLVGVLPDGATGATVSGVGRKGARAEMRGRWFLALLEPADPSVLNLETLDVDFEY
jgi:hypothetical protein